jgi:hypothetical protein
VLTLAFSGVTILMAHPRLYWGEAGNDLTPAWLALPISHNHRTYNVHRLLLPRTDDPRHAGI